MYQELRPRYWWTKMKKEIVPRTKTSLLQTKLLHRSNIDGTLGQLYGI
jgi:hypothetical protein